MTDEQTRDLVETLRDRVAHCDGEAGRWRGFPMIARHYAGQRAAYRDVLNLIATAQGETPANPLTPPAPASSYVERGD